MVLLSALFALLRFSSGRRISVYNQLRVIATRLGLPSLVRHIDRAIAHDMRTRDLDDRWEAQSRKGHYPVEVQEIDNLVDQTLTGIRDIAAAQASGVPEHDLLHDDVNRFLAEIFPAGVAAITALPYVDQVAAVENILAKLRGELAHLVARFGLEHKVAHLARLTVEYRRGVDARYQPLDFATVRDARERGHQYLLEIVSLIVGTFYDSENPQHVAARNELLAPVMAHQDIVRAGYRARRNPQDGDAPAEAAELAEIAELAEAAELAEVALGEPRLAELAGAHDALTRAPAADSNADAGSAA